MLSGTTFHVDGTTRMYDRSKFSGGVAGEAIDMIASGHVPFDGSTRCRNITFD